MGDGDELIAGTDPTDPESCFRIERVEQLPDGSILLNWQSVPWQLYVVEVSDAITGPWKEVSELIPSDRGAADWKDLAGDGVGTGFYRIRPMLP